MGPKISNLCGGGEKKGMAEVEIDTKYEPPTEEVVKAKSINVIQSKWKASLSRKIMNGLKLKKVLDKQSNEVGELITIEEMKSKISQQIVTQESNMPPFNKEPDIRQFLTAFERDPIRLKDGSIYHGQWNEKGQKHGYGVLVRFDGSKYEGFFMNDVINGRGRYIDCQGGFHYEGMWKDNKADGKGSYILSDGTKYTGDWKDDIQEGQGEEVSPDGTVYKGMFKDGEKNGKGHVKWTDGSSFEGDFVKSTIHGYGVYKWSDGREYKGMWENGKMHGKGIFTWPDGKYYDGEYKNDKKDGYGKYVWDGKSYEGTWFNGKQNGYGCVYVNNELVLKGFWRYGKIIKKDFEKKDNADTFSILTNDNVNIRNVNGNANANNDHTQTKQSTLAVEEPENQERIANR
jgi:hypothetical protein